MKACLNLNLQYTEAAGSTKDGVPVIAMRHRVRDRARAKHTTEWIYMEPADARELLATLAVTVDEISAQHGKGSTPWALIPLTRVEESPLPGQLMKIQTELGDIYLPEVDLPSADLAPQPPDQTILNKGIEFFKVKFPDLPGSAQWTVLRNSRSVKVDMLHQNWLDAYHRREFAIQPGDSLKCRFEERVSYDVNGNEVERKVSIVEVLEVITPPSQTKLDLRPR